MHRIVARSGVDTKDARVTCAHLWSDLEAIPTCARANLAVPGPVRTRESNLVKESFAIAQASYPSNGRTVVRIDRFLDRNANHTRGRRRKIQYSVTPIVSIRNEIDIAAHQAGRIARACETI